MGSASEATGEWGIAAPAWPLDAISRRRLLQLGAAGAVAVAAPLAAGRARAGAGIPVALRRSTYLPLVGERFTVAAGAGSAALRLVEVRGRDDAFALLFHGSGRPRLEQAVRRIAHPAIGTAELLMVPAGTGRRGQDYEIVVNRTRGGPG
jgi:hypothetical protein